MHLVIDIGNSSIHCGLFEGTGCRRSFRMPTAMLSDAADTIAAARMVFGDSVPERAALERVTIGSVVPELTESVAAAFADTSAPAHIVTHESPLTITLAMEQPETVGVDRIANIEAFWTKHRKPGIVVDCGTATTYDVVDAGGHFLGGVIAPGIGVANAQLHRAAQLHPVPLERPDSVIGRTTDQAIAAGQYYAALGAIERTLGELKVELGAEPAPLVVTTGGLGEELSRLVPSLRNCDKVLTLRGLMQIGNRVGA